jgi:hypothetical protein
VSIDDGAPYACEDVIVTHKLNEVLAQELVNYAKLYKLLFMSPDTCHLTDFT